MISSTMQSYSFLSVTTVSKVELGEVYSGFLDVMSCRQAAVIFLTTPQGTADMSVCISYGGV